MKLSKHILVVEDEPDTAELLEFHLENAGYKVTIAEDGYEALKKIHKLRPDLLILDLMIPEIDGFEVCRLIRKDPANESLPVMMCTAKSDETSKIQGLDFGADDYVTKPFSPREVVLRVKNLLKRIEFRPETCDSSNWPSQIAVPTRAQAVGQLPGGLPKTGGRRDGLHKQGLGMHLFGLPCCVNKRHRSWYFLTPMYLDS